MTKDFKYSFPLSKIRPSDKIGGKAESLYALYRKRIPIPQTLVIGATAFEDYSKGFVRELHDNTGDFDTLRSVQKYSEELSEAFLKKSIDGALFDQIYGSIHRTFGRSKLIFRSSAVGEDSKENSFAGQLDSAVTDMNENFKIACRDALLQCWMSYWKSRSTSYQCNRSTILGGMSVVVQPYIQSEISGVLFTSHPLSANRKDENRPFVLECVMGAGEQLVSGREDPEQFLIYDEAKGMRIFSCLPGNDGSGLLDPWKDNIEHLVEIAGRIVKETGKHQDIEWVIDKFKRLWILQSRPVTAQNQEKDRIYVWSNANVNENFPEALVPFLMSFAKNGYYYYFRNLAGLLGVSRKVRKQLEPAFETIIDFHQSRMYYNLTNIYECLSAFPLPGLAKQYWDAFIGIYDLPYENLSDRLLPKNRLARSIYFLIVVSLSLKHLLCLPHYARRFERQAENHIRRCNSEEGAHSVYRYRSDVKNFIDIRMYKWKDASLADALAMFGYGFLRSAVKQYAPSLSASVHQLLIGIPNLVSHESPQRLWKLAEMIKTNHRLHSLFGEDPKRIMSVLDREEEYDYFYRAFVEYQKGWGYRISGELLLTRADYAEAPEKLIDLLKGYLKNPFQSPEEQLETQIHRRIEVTKQILQHAGQGCALLTGLFRKTVICLSIFLAHQGIKYRERVRLKQAGLYNQCRHSLLALGGILKKKDLVQNAEDILFLKYSEIEHLSTCHVPALIREVIRQRRNEYTKDMKCSLPESFYLPGGEFYCSEKKESLKIVETPETQEYILSGYTACEGQVVGRIKILKDIASIGMIEKGDILVTKQTDPGWAPAFPIISGLIVERGGMLSHGAIIAREYGIPTLVGVKDATTRLTNGQLVLLDADRSVVFPREVLQS
jgi:rifampicin phosphotransferase